MNNQKKVKSKYNKLQLKYLKNKKQIRKLKSKNNIILNNLQDLSKSMGYGYCSSGDCLYDNCNDCNSKRRDFCKKMKQGKWENE